MFYRILFGSDQKYRYARCRSFSYGDVQKVSCPACGRDIVTPIYAEGILRWELEGGRILPDFLQSVNCWPRHFLASQRAWDILQQERITGLGEIQPVESTCDPQHQDSRDMAYYDVQITGRIDWDLQAMGLKKKNLCPQCRQFDWNRQRLYPEYIAPDTWDGSDLCRLDSVPGVVVCSGQFAEVVRRHNLTGLDLQSIPIK